MVARRSEDDFDTGDEEDEDGYGYVEDYNERGDGEDLSEGSLSNDEEEVEEDLSDEDGREG